MNRTLLTVLLVGAVTLSATAARAEGQISGAEPTGPVTVRMPTTAPNWTPTAEGAIARQRIHDAGYNGVTQLSRNPDGSWEGQALKGDTYYLITLDRAGHVIQH